MVEMGRIELPSYLHIRSSSYDNKIKPKLKVRGNMPKALDLKETFSLLVFRSTRPRLDLYLYYTLKKLKGQQLKPIYYTMLVFRDNQFQLIIFRIFKLPTTIKVNPMSFVYHPQNIYPHKPRHLTFDVC